MTLSEQNILFFTRTMGLGGTENVVLQLCEIFKPIVNKIIVCSCGGVNVDKLKKAGIIHYEIADIENKSPAVLISNIRKVHKIIKEEKITIIHTHHRMAAFYVATLGLYRKYIFINTSHNTFHDKKVLTHFAYRKAGLIACGEMVKKNLAEYFNIPGSQITVIHNAVKPFDGKLTADPFIEKMKNNNYFIVGNIGRLSKQKGMEFYIRAIPDIVTKHPDTKFLVIGDGEDKEKLIVLAKELKVDDYVVFMGYRSDVQNLMAQMDLVVLSSLWEGLPLTPIEAFSVGKTIVATAVDGTPEIVKDGENGLLIDAKSAEQIAEKVIWMIENPDNRTNMERAAEEHFIKEFSFEHLADSYKAFYEKFNQ